jgi:hypothetical protein
MQTNFPGSWGYAFVRELIDRQKGFADETVVFG